MTMTVVHTFATAGSAILSCDELQFNADLKVWDAKITALPVDTLSNAPAEPALQPALELRSLVWLTPAPIPCGS